MISVATAAEMHVAKSTPSTGIPVSAKIRGFTTTMYAMVTNVVSPPSISCLTEVRFSASLK